MSAASWIRATCCTSPRSFSWCDKEQSDVVDSLKMSFCSEKAKDTLLIKDRETQLFSGDLILLIVRRVFFSFRPDLITFLKAISVSQSHLSSSIVSWD